MPSSPLLERLKALATFDSFGGRFRTEAVFWKIADVLEALKCPHGNTIGACSWCDLRDDGGLPEAQHSGEATPSAATRCVCTVEDSLVQEWVSKARAVAKQKGFSVELGDEEFCLGCGQSTARRDCGCPAGTGWRRRSDPDAIKGAFDREVVIAKSEAHACMTQGHLEQFVEQSMRLSYQMGVAQAVAKGWTPKADPVSPSLPSDLPRVGVCYKHKAAEWQGCYTICGWCKASLHYVTVEEAERITGRQRPKDWPNNVIGYKPVSPSLDQEKRK